MTGVLALAAAAVVAGSRSFTAIAGWAADVPADVLEDLCRRSGATRPGARAPSKATIWRVVTRADTAALDGVAGAWLMERAGAAGDLTRTGPGRDDDAPLIPVWVDGKTVRGARNADGSQAHLLAALAGLRGVVAAQAQVDAKTNEIPMIIPLINGLSLTGPWRRPMLSTRSVPPRTRCTGAARASVKDNQPGLFDALDALPWRDVPVAHAATGRGHGRITTRTIQVLDAPGDLPFLHVSQTYLIERQSPPWTARPCPTSPRSASPASTPPRPAPRPSPGSSAASGRSSPCTGCVTPSTVKTSPRSVPAPGHGP